VLGGSIVEPVGYEVFISHSSKDKKFADAVCAFLEARGVSCWIAPRDITPGKDWSEAIVAGIAACKVLVFLFSAQSNESIQVRREVQRASERGLHVVPVRLEEIMPGPALEYYISSIHWMNAVAGLSDEVLTELYERITPSLPDRVVVAPPTSEPEPEPEPAATIVAATAPAVQKHNLPFSATSFVGRERELEDIQRLLCSIRLLTLTGLGGCGKTRLTLKAASNLVEEFPDGVRLVELAPLEDENLVVQTVAGVCGIREVPGEPLLQTLINTLATKRMLLVLDNCEHLLSACARLIDRLIRSCDNVRILATSREALNIPGEQIYRVPPLTLPNPRVKQTPESILQFASARLFIERATTVQPNFTVTEANAHALASICARLDGIPLAIELAAARVKSLSVEDIDKRLDQCFRLLTGGSRTALPRQQTLRALFDWSYGLLTEPEKTLLHRLTLLAGGWTLEAAEAICSGGDVEDWEVLDLLTSLVDKSLVVAEIEESSTRYHMLETVRQYGRDKLRELGEEEEYRDRHRDWFLALAEDAEPHLLSAEQGQWFNRLETEHDNLRVAIARCFETPQGAEAGLRLTAALWRFWATHGHLTQGREYLAQALAQQGAEAPTSILAKALNGEGTMAWNQGDYASARACMEQALEINRQIGDRAGEAANLDGLGLVARNQGDYAAALSYQEQALALLEPLGNRAGEASNLGNLGLVAWNQGNYVAARDYLEQSRNINRKIGDRAGEATNLNGLGLLARNQGDYEASNAYFEEALRINEEIGSRDRAAANLNGIGLVRLDQGEYDAARSYKMRSLEINREIGNRMGEAINLYFLGQVSRYQGPAWEARIYMEQSLAINREIGNRMGQASNLYGLSLVALDEGDLDAARAYLDEALKLYLALGQNQAIAESLEAFAALAKAHRDFDRATRLYAAALALREKLGAPVPFHLRDDHQNHHNELRDALGESRYNEAHEAGKQMSVQEATTYASEMPA